MSLDKRRVVAVRTALGQFGSGYLVKDDLVLTALHVVDDGSPVEVRGVGEGSSWVRAERSWPSAVPAALDAALLTTETPLVRSAAPVIWGSLQGNEEFRCTAVGFPRAAVNERFSETEQVFGRIAPLSGLKGSMYEVTVQTRAPLEPSGEGSPWSGISGAALFEQRHLIGVLVQAPANFGTNALTALPVQHLLDDQTFARALGPGEHIPEPVSTFCMQVGDRLYDCDLPFRVVLKTPEKLRLSARDLLNPSHRVVPFVERDLFQQLVDWAIGPGGPQVAVLTGRRGSGKTRLAIELCMELLQHGWEAGFFSLSHRTSAGGMEGMPCLMVVDAADLSPQVAGALLTHVNGSETKVLLISRRPESLQPLVDKLGDDETSMLEARQDFALPDRIDVDFRQDLYRLAAEAFGHILEAEHAPRRRRLDEDDFGSIRTVVLAALEEVLASFGDELVTRMFERLHQAEIKRWDQVFESASAGIPPAAALCVWILTGADSVTRLGELLETVKESSIEDREKVAGALLGNGMFESPIQDLVLAGVLVERPDLPVALYARGTEAEQRCVVSVLHRATRRDAKLVPVLRRLVAHDLADLVEEAWAGHGSELVQAVADALREHPDLPVDPALDAQAGALTVLSRMPRGVPPTLAEALWRCRVRHLRRQPGDRMTLEALATALREQVFWERESGHPEEALQTVGGLLDHLTRLGAGPAARAHALQTRGLLLMDLSADVDAALADLRAAVEILEREAAAREDLRIALGRARHSLAVGLARHGDGKQAVNDLALAIEEVTGATDGETVAAGMRIDLGAMLVDQQRHQEAADQLSGAIALLRTRSIGRDLTTILRLVEALRERSFAYQQLGRREAIDDMNEAIAWAGSLAEADPGAYGILLAQLKDFEVQLHERMRAKRVVDSGAER